MPDADPNATTTSRDPTARPPASAPPTGRRGPAEFAAQPSSGRDLTFDASLPFADEAAAAARRAMAEHLLEHGAPRVAVENATLVVHELIHNGIDHGEPCDDHTLKVAWMITSGLIVINVTDCGTSEAHGDPAADGSPTDPDAPDSPDPSDPAQRWRRKLLQPLDLESGRGRGLHLVAAMSRSWEVHTGPDGTTVTAHVSLDR